MSLHYEDDHTYMSPKLGTRPALYDPAYDGAPRTHAAMVDADPMSLASGSPRAMRRQHSRGGANDRVGSGGGGCGDGATADYRVFGNAAFEDEAPAAHQQQLGATLNIKSRLSSVPSPPMAPSPQWADADPNAPMGPSQRRSSAVSTPTHESGNGYKSHASNNASMRSPLSNTQRSTTNDMNASMRSQLNNTQRSTANDMNASMRSQLNSTQRSTANDMNASMNASMRSQLNNTGHSVNSVLNNSLKSQAGKSDVALDRIDSTGRHSGNSSEPGRKTMYNQALEDELRETPKTKSRLSFFRRKKDKDEDERP